MNSNPVFDRLMANKHTSGAAVVYIGCFAFAKIGTIWFPEHSQQFKQTLDAVKDIAVTYGFIMAGDAKKDKGGDSNNDNDNNGSESTDKNPMKTNGSMKLTALVIAAVGIIAMCFGARAHGQTPASPPVAIVIPDVPETNATPPLTPASFLPTVASWFTSSDPNNTLFDDATITGWAGNSYVNNDNNASSLGLDIRLYKFPTAGLQLHLESETLNAGIAGTLYSQQVGLQLAKAMHDVRVGAFVDPGYSFAESKPFIAVGIDARKAMGKVSFIYGRIGYEFIQKRSAGVFEAGVGVKF